MLLDDETYALLGYAATIEFELAFRYERRRLKIRQYQADYEKTTKGKEARKRADDKRREEGYWKRHYAKNRERIIAYAKDWQRKNKARKAEYDRISYERNREKRLAYSAEYARKNRAKINARQKQRREKARASQP